MLTAKHSHDRRPPLRGGCQRRPRIDASLIRIGLLPTRATNLLKLQGIIDNGRSVAGLLRHHMIGTSAGGRATPRVGRVRGLETVLTHMRAQMKHSEASNHMYYIRAPELVYSSEDTGYDNDDMTTTSNRLGKSLSRRVDVRKVTLHPH